MPDVALDCLLRKEEPDADLAIHETVRNQLEHLDLSRRRLLLQLLQGLKRDHLGDRGLSASGHGLEPGGVLPVPGQNCIALGGIHAPAIGRTERQL